MDETEIWSLLVRGRGVRMGHFAGRNGHFDLRVEKYNGLFDPAGAETLGRALAGRLKELGADVVMVCQDLGDLILGFVVARELECGLVRVYDDAGLLGHSRNLPLAARAVLVADQSPDPGIVRAASVLLEDAGGSLLGVGVLVQTGLSGDPNSVGLVSVKSRLHVPGECPLCVEGVPLEEVMG